jgi:hypothetical protein
MEAGGIFLCFFVFCFLRRGVVFSASSGRLVGVGSVDVILGVAAFAMLLCSRVWLRISSAVDFARLRFLLQAR